MATATAPVRAARVTETNGQRQQIVLPEDKFVSVLVTLQGVTPLLTNPFSDEAKDAIIKDQGGDAASKRKKDPRDPRAEFNRSVYVRDDNTYGFPALGFVKAIRSAAIRMSEIKGTVAAAAWSLDTPDEFLQVLDGDGEPVSFRQCELDNEWPRYRCDHVVRMGRGNVAHRAEFYPWTIILPALVDVRVMSLQQFVDLTNQAGRGIGIGNWRPEKSGRHGTFRVTAAY